ELMRLSRSSPTTRPLSISKELFAVLTYAQEVSAQTDGAFDVTVGPLVKLWRRARKTKVLPTPAELAAARSAVGWRFLRLHPEDQSAELLTRGMSRDLGGIEQFLGIGGVRYSHVVEPRTGFGLTDHYAATVIAPRGITTDSLSTAATLVGPGRAEALFRHFRARGFLRKIAPQTSTTASSTTSR